LSSYEVEYVSYFSTACQATWLQNAMEDLIIKLKHPIRLLINNKSEINLVENLIARGKNKH